MDLFSKIDGMEFDVDFQGKNGAKNCKICDLKTLLEIHFFDYFTLPHNLFI